MIDLIDELKAVTRALEAAQIPYALCGGLALAPNAQASRPR
jgi:hypothetical protein